jgi:hypothetical protein
MRHVLAHGSNLDVLLECVHAELFGRTGLTEVKQLTLFDKKLLALADTCEDFRTFVS